MIIEGRIHILGRDSVELSFPPTDYVLPSHVDEDVEQKVVPATNPTNTDRVHVNGCLDGLLV
jgi:hypothetical protein